MYDIEKEYLVNWNTRGLWLGEIWKVTASYQRKKPITLLDLLFPFFALKLLGPPFWSLPSWTVTYSPVKVTWKEIIMHSAVVSQHIQIKEFSHVI